MVCNITDVTKFYASINLAQILPLSKSSASDKYLILSQMGMGQRGLRFPSAY
jgi:hypothetical protein